MAVSESVWIIRDPICAHMISSGTDIVVSQRKLFQSRGTCKNRVRQLVYQIVAVINCSLDLFSCFGWLLVVRSPTHMLFHVIDWKRAREPYTVILDSSKARRHVSRSLVNFRSHDRMQIAIEDMSCFETWFSILSICKPAKFPAHIPFTALIGKENESHI